MQVFDIEIDR